MSETAPQNHLHDAGVKRPEVSKTSLRMQSSTGFKKSPTTLVTSFFPMNSKYGRDNLEEWLERLLSIDDPMVIFTSPETVTTLAQMRQHAVDHTKIIAISLEDVPLARKYPTAVWDDQFEKDSKRKRHTGREEYIVWLSRTWFLNEAVNLNPFQSSNFMFTDISSFKSKAVSKRWKGKTIMDHPEVIPKDRMLFMAHHDPYPPPSLWLKGGSEQYHYHSNAFVAGNKLTIPKLHDAFGKVIQGYLDRGLFIGNDSIIAQSTCLLNPELCAYVRPSQIKNDSPFYALRLVLKEGGKYSLWLPPAKRE